MGEPSPDGSKVRDLPIHPRQDVFEAGALGCAGRHAAVDLLQERGDVLEREPELLQ
jgi:hypothetical protein